MLPLLAIAVYEVSAIPASAVGVGLLLLLSICAGTAVLGCTSNVWLTADTLSARVVEPVSPWLKEMRSRVAWMVPSDVSLPVTSHCCSWNALTQAIEIRVAGS